jgi:mercuric ion transport protein
MSKISESVLGTGILLAIASSLCCIVPVIAVIFGLSGAASNLSWIAPFRPYLIVVTLLLLGFAFYQTYRPKMAVACGCAVENPKKFIHSKSLLWTLAVLSIMVMTFPYYSHVFFSKNEKYAIIVDKNNIQTVEIRISGMTCSSCEEEVKHEVNKLMGIIKADVSYDKGTADIPLDNNKTEIKEMTKAINLTGYRVIQSEIKNK